MTQSHWEGEMGKVTQAMFGQAILGLPQRESRFSVLHYTPENFPEMLRTHRNILLADVGADFTNTGVRQLYEKWARKQQVVQLAAPDTLAWINLLNREGEALMNLYDEVERGRLQRIQRANADVTSAQMLADEFGIRLAIPADFELARNRANFKHFRRDRVLTSKSQEGSGFAKMGHQVIDGIFVYKYPYTSDSTFTRPALMNMRDSLLKYNVRGSNKEAYMSTQRFFEDLDLRPALSTTNIDSTFATEMRGLWGMVNAKMGGPFISVSFISPSGKEVIAVEGYCFAPQFDKREFLRYVDAIVFSAEMIK